MKRFLVMVLMGFMFISFSGCASVSSAVSKPNELKLRWNVSYLRGLVIVQGALKTEPIQFEKALIGKDAAKLKGNYADGGTIQIIISKISNSESSVTANAGASLAAKEEARRILEEIAQYSKGAK